MWELFFLRPDAVTALEDEMVQSILPRYIKAVNDELPANFQILKKIEFEPKKSLTDQQLWKIHDKLMKDFYDLKKKLDNSKINIDDLKPPRLSLLDLKIQLVKEMMKSCELCERKCRVNRLKGELGDCKVGNDCSISSAFVHIGEEDHIVPSMTVFFMGCNFHCEYCQNWSISQWCESGCPITSRQLAEKIERGRREKCRNVNYVGGSPTPSLLWVLESLKYCNVNIPTIWNSNMYMSEKAMKILDGVVDMFLSDFKYGNDDCALRLSKVQNYFEICSRNHLLAAKRAEITLRHLILPNHVECCSKPILEWVAKNIREKCIVNLMDQYHPEYKASEHPDVNRRITSGEFESVIDLAKKLKINYIT